MKMKIKDTQIIDGKFFYSLLIIDCMVNPYFEIAVRVCLSLSVSNQKIIGEKQYGFCDKMNQPLLIVFTRF